MKNFVQTDSGRTMLEALLVIILVGLLSITSLNGYQMIVAKNEAQTINKQLYQMVQERLFLLKQII